MLWISCSQRSSKDKIISWFNVDAVSMPWSLDQRRSRRKPEQKKDAYGMYGKLLQYTGFNLRLEKIKWFKIKTRLNIYLFIIKDKLINKTECTRILFFPSKIMFQNAILVGVLEVFLCYQDNFKLYIWYGGRRTNNDGIINVRRILRAKGVHWSGRPTIWTTLNTALTKLDLLDLFHY